MLLLWLLVLICLMGPPVLIVILVRYCDVIGTRSFAFQVIALGCAALGIAPVSVLAMLWYVRSADYAWALSGPAPFAYLGSGPTLLWGLLLVGASTTICWLAALWFSARAARDV